MKKKEREFEIFNLSFLDVISCAFGALILILLIVRPGIEEIEDNLNVKDFENLVLEISKKKENIFKIKENIFRLNTDIESIDTDKLLYLEKIESINDSLLSLSESLEAAEDSNSALKEVEGTLLEAKINSSKKNLKRDEEVGGIIVDSDYVVFIVDTSGSMQQIWDRVMNEISNILDIHPKVEGFQILNDNGIHLIDAYKYKWIPDTPSRRNNVLKILKNWNSTSNSSPVEGLATALKKYSQNGLKTSIYIFGDDYSGSSYTEVFSVINKLNSDNKNNVRINGIGFFSPGTTMRFPTLMRVIAENNRGTYIGLPFK